VFLATMIAAVSVAVAARRSHVLPAWFAIYGLGWRPHRSSQSAGSRSPFNNGVLLASLELTLLLLLIRVGIFSIQVARNVWGMPASEAAPVPAT
jgi:hypothetical protein